MNSSELDNLAKYEGYLEVDPAHLAELIALVTDLVADAARLLASTTPQRPHPQ